MLTYGASLHRLTVPDTAGAAASVVRSLPALDDYTAKHPYFGAVVGRYANRIAHGRFVLDGTEHHIPANDRGHALHGGPDGFHTKVWDAAPDRTDDSASVRLTLHSPDGDMGFPGALDTTRHVHPRHGRHAGRRLRVRHRPPHRRQPHQPRLLRPVRR